jgi:HK97 family phage prohead protease
MATKGNRGTDGGGGSRIERREMEVRAVAGDGGEMAVEGNARVFDSPATHSYGGRSFTEVIKAGALDGTDMKDVPLRYNHAESVMLMARTRNRSLRLAVDQKGLKISADLIDTQSNRDLFKGIQEGLIDRMSFAFSVADGGDAWTFGKDSIRREVNNIEKLWDVSVVDSPFYDDTSVYARSFDLLDSEMKRLESHEREILKLRIKSKQP